MKKVLIISTSLRVGSNSEFVAHEFEKGAKEAGHVVEFISLKDKNIAFCKGCLACQETQKCVIKDDAIAIADKMAKSDVIVWVTPIYYYEMSGQMKTLIDRCNSLFARDVKFKEVYLLTVAAEGGARVPKHAIAGVQGWVDCFDEVEFKKSLFLSGLDIPYEVKNDRRLKRVYRLGKSI